MSKRLKAAASCLSAGACAFTLTDDDANAPPRPAFCNVIEDRTYTPGRKAKRYR
jgi:hypothetical protein